MSNLYQKRPCSGLPNRLVGWLCSTYIQTQAGHPMGSTNNLLQTPKPTPQQPNQGAMPNWITFGLFIPQF